MIPFSRYVINCFHGTPAKPKLPGQNTEHCEQTVDASLGFEKFWVTGRFLFNCLGLTAGQLGPRTC